MHHGLLWRNNYLFVATLDSRIKKIDARTGSTISSWPVPHADFSSCIALPQHGKFIAYSAEKTIIFLDTESGITQPRLIQLTGEIHSMSFSSDDQLLAIAVGTKIIIRDPSSVLLRFPSVCFVSCLRSIFTTSQPFQEPELGIDIATLNAWKCHQLTHAEALLSATILTSKNGPHHVLASRALVRARLGHWDTALVDAKEVPIASPSHM